MGRVLRSKDAYPSAYINTSSPWWNTSKIGMIAFGVFSFCYLYAATHFYRDPGSAFFDQKRAYERYYSLTRENQALEYQDMVATSVENATHGWGDSVRLQKAGSDPQMCAAFVTVARPGIGNQPIELSVASALATLSPAERSDIYFSIYFSHVFPENHKSWRSSWLSNAVDELIVPHQLLTDQERRIHESLEREKNYVYKASVDYAKALEHCLNVTNAPYIALFEDDILFADGWAARSFLNLKKIIETTTAQGKPDSWLDMRLFVDEKSIAYADRRVFGNHIPLISIGVGSGLLVALLMLRRKSRFFAQHLDNGALFIICVVCVPAFLSLFYQSGKASMLPAFPGVYEEGSGCCGQAQIIRREAVPELAEYMRSRAAQLPYDRALWSFSHDTWLSRWTQYPNVVQHTGLKSLLWPDRKDKDWSMAFEMLSAKTLQNEHKKMVDELYGAGAWTS